MQQDAVSVPSGALVSKQDAPSAGTWLGVLLAAALLLRVALIVRFRNRSGYDVSVFISWAHLLMRYGTHGLYAHVDTVSHNIVNYPPGYQLVLYAVTLAYRALVPAPHENAVVLEVLLKTPAIAADLVLCILSFWIVRRWYGSRAGLSAAALAAFSPATWPISAIWGQIDSLCAVFMVAALACTFSRRYTAAWILLAVATLIKPLPVVVAPLLLAAQLRDERQHRRILLGPALSLLCAYAASLPFAATFAPLGVMRWLLQNYAAGESLLNVTSSGAYNVWTLVGTPPADSLRVYGLTLQAWAWAAYGTFVAAVLVHYVRRSIREVSGPRLESLTARAWFIVLAGMFCLLTRMHERYILYALALLPIVWFCGKVERAAAVTWLATFVLGVLLATHLGQYAGMWQAWALMYALAVVNVVTWAATAARFFGLAGL